MENKTQEYFLGYEDGCKKTKETLLTILEKYGEKRTIIDISKMIEIIYTLKND